MLNSYKLGKSFLQFGVSFVFVLSAFCGLSAAEVVGSVEMAGVETFDCEKVCNGRADQWRWLSVPLSRLVLNPAGSGYETDGLEPTLGLDIGYYVGDEPRRLTDVVGCRLVDDAKQGQSWNYSINFAEEFGKDKSGWNNAGLIKEVDSGIGKITIADPNWKETWGGMGFDVKPGFKCMGGKLRIKIAKSDGWWSLKFKNAAGEDAVLQKSTNQTGTFIYDLEDFEGCCGSEQFNLGIFIQHPDKSIWIESMDLELYSESTKSEVGEYKTKWYPHKIGFEVEYPKLSRQLGGCDFFADENSVYRLIETKGGKECQLEIAGAITGEFEKADNVLVMEYEDFFYAVGLGEIVGDKVRALDGKVAVDKWFWSLRVELAKDSDKRIVAATGFSTKAEGKAKAIERAKGMFKKPGPVANLQSRKEKWDELLKKVPAPKEFGIKNVASKGVTAEEHRLFYYGAWAFTIMNVIPAMGENDYAYPQTPCGKPSLWNHGASKARASAAWESFFSQQFLSYVMPEVAWDAFEGIMMQVDEDGWLNGECLPSRKAQTAWILYNNMPDKKRLAKVYPPIKRYLFWREKNPRWIYGKHDFANEKSSHFIEQLLSDIDFAAEIAETLGYEDDIKMWQLRHKENIKNYRKWFFFKDGRDPAAYYFTDTKSYRKGNPWTASAGLHIRDLPADMKQQIIKFYLSAHDVNKPLVGAGYCKYGSSSFQAYGLLEGGLEKEGWEFINALLRDQIIAGDFSEGYLRRRRRGDSGKRIIPWGVRPSYFGVGQMIDFTLMNNGVRIDGGKAVGIGK